MLEIKVTMETQYGLERAIRELGWLLSWRGKVVGYYLDATTPGKIELMARISHDWQNSNKVAALTDWFEAKAHFGFRVTAVESLTLQEKTARDANLIMLKEPA